MRHLDAPSPTHGLRPGPRRGNHSSTFRRAVPLLLALLLGALYSAQAQSSPHEGVPCSDSCCHTDVLVINSGYNNDTGHPYPVGVADNFWTVTADPAGGIVPRCARVIVPSPVWKPPFPNSQWISSNPTEANNVNGRYSYQKCFCVCEEGDFYFDLRAMADDGGTITLDGMPVGVLPLASPPAETRFTFTRHLLPGQHCIEVNVDNTQQISSGFDLSGSIQGDGLLKFSCCGTRCDTTRRHNDPPYDPPCDTTSLKLGSDSSWTIVEDPAGGIVPRCANTITRDPIWGLPIPGSKWIGTSGGLGTTPVLDTFVYRKCFCVSRRTTLTARIRVMGDDQVNVVFDGDTILSVPNFAARTPDTILLPISLDSGCHCFYFRVYNEGGVVSGLDAMIELDGYGLVKEQCCECAFCWKERPPLRMIDPSGEPAAEPPGRSGNTLLSIPNPTTGETTIRYTLRNGGDVRLDIYDAAGKLVETLEHGFRSAGNHAVSYNAATASSGSYHVRLSVGSEGSYTIPLQVQR